MKKTIAILTLILGCGIISAQNYDLGKVSIDEVTNNTYAQDTSASAVILYKHRNTYFDHAHPDGWVIVTEVHKRIKILNKDGLDYATETIPLYKSSKAKERVSGIKGYTHNDVGGKVKSEKLKKSAIFNTKRSDNWNETSFTMPNVKVGSVVEWTYKVTSPYYKIDDLVIQEDIPTKHYFGKIETLNYFNFKRIAKGGDSVSPKEYAEPRTLTVMWEQDTNGALTQATRSSTIQTTEYVHEYQLRDIPGLKDEPYVDNIENYRFVINYELMSVKFPNGPLRQYSTTWDEVVKTINKSDDFGDQLKKTKYFRDDLASLVDKSEGAQVTLEKVFNYVRDNMTWDGKYSKYTKKGVQKAYKERTGNVSEINIMLVAMLRESGIEANPVLVSTRKHGIPAFPTIEGFNYVIACASINGQDILMDATEKNALPGLIPERAINWEGTLVTPDDRFRKIRLYPDKASQRNTLLSVEISDDGSIIGTQSNSFTMLNAFEYRNNFKDVNQNSYMEALLNTYQLDDVTELKVDNVDDFEKNIKESFSFEQDEGAQVIGGEIYFSPLFYLAIEENPFKLEDRQFPINYSYPRLQRRIVNIKIPEGYTVSSLPKPIKINLPENLGSFLFNITEVEGGISVRSDFKINSAVIPSYGYGELKEFYDQRVKKEAEKVVLTRM